MLSLIIGIIFTLGGLGILGASGFEFARANYAQDQMIPVGEMIVGAILLAGGGICFSLWATARKQLAALLRPQPVDPSGPAILEALTHIYNAAKKSNDLEEKILQRSTAGVAAAPKPLTLYFYADAEMKPHGPFAGSTLKEMLRDGLINKDSPVAVEGSDKWLPCSNYSELS